MGKSARIAIKTERKILFIDAEDVMAVEAKRNYIALLDTSSSHLLRESISTMEEKLNLHGFVRIHRSVLVNAALVEEIRPLSPAIMCSRCGEGENSPSLVLTRRICNSWRRCGSARRGLLPSRNSRHQNGNEPWDRGVCGKQQRARSGNCESCGRRSATTHAAAC